jgi:nucleotide-binding universal stress UspA family protein
MFETILVGIKSPLICSEAVMVAGKIAKQNDGELNILHVLETLDENGHYNLVKDFKTGRDTLVTLEYEEKVKKQIRVNYDDMIRQLNIVNYKISLSKGNPWEETV